MEAGTEIAKRQEGALAAPGSELTLDQLVHQVTLIQQALHGVMKDGEHYGVIPGTDKPTLLKPGAEKLCLLFRLAPKYEIERIWDGDHMTVEVTCSLTHIPSGSFMGSGEAMASTKEAKYAYRNAKPTCPECGNATVFKSKHGEGFFCWKKEGGCGANFQADDERIKSQKVGKIDNPDLPDTYNTVTKMGCKRALVAAVLNATAASDIFSQDVEDLPGFGKPVEEKVSEEDLSVLVNMLATAVATDPETWADDAVLDAARRRFKRPVANLADLTPQEAHTIIRGVEAWLDEHAPATPEVVSDGTDG